MPTAFTRNFGAIEYQQAELFFFPQGLPGFADETKFLPVELPDQFPLVYLQSLRTPDLCFAALPVNSVITGYRLGVTAGDLEGIGLRPDVQVGTDMLCLALICFAEEGAAANLRAPVIINLKNRMAAQIIQNDDRYPIRFPLVPSTEVAVC